MVDTGECSRSQAGVLWQITGQYLQAGVGHWLETPDTGPEGWRFRLQANIVLPR